MRRDVWKVLICARDISAKPLDRYWKAMERLYVLLVCFVSLTLAEVSYNRQITEFEYRGF